LPGKSCERISPLALDNGPVAKTFFERGKTRVNWLKCRGIASGIARLPRDGRSAFTHQKIDLAPALTAPGTARKLQGMLAWRRVTGDIGVRLTERRNQAIIDGGRSGAACKRSRRELSVTAAASTRSSEKVRVTPLERGSDANDVTPLSDAKVLLLASRCAEVSVHQRRRWQRTHAEGFGGAFSRVSGLETVFNGPLAQMPPNSRGALHLSPRDVV
jgi:hypothetical protein